METSVVRKRVSDTIEKAKRQAADRRIRGDEASRVYAEFLGTIAWQREGKAGLHINECRTTRGEIALPRSLAGEAATGD